MIELRPGVWVSYLHIVKIQTGSSAWCHVHLTDGDAIRADKPAKDIISELTEWLTR